MSISRYSLAVFTGIGLSGLLLGAVLFARHERETRLREWEELMREHEQLQKRARILLRDLDKEFCADLAVMWATCVQTDAATPWILALYANRLSKIAGEPEKDKGTGKLKDLEKPRHDQKEKGKGA